MKVAIVAAVSRNGVIGNEGQLPWRLPGDMKHFRELTTGHAVIMGRKTYESLPKAFTPLPDRINIVVTHEQFFTGCSMARSFEEALQIAKAERPDDNRVFVIGGEQLYREALPVADEVLKTEVEADIEGDAHFPSMDSGEWHVVTYSRPLEENGLKYRFVRYKHDRTLLYWPEAARSPEQREQMEWLEAGDTCVFCRENVEHHRANPVMFEGEHWYVTLNDFPYNGTKHHLLIVPQVHIKALDELPPGAGDELIGHVKEIKRRYQPLSEAVVARSGDMKRNGGSVAHLHVHFVVGETANLDLEAIKFKITSAYPA